MHVPVALFFSLLVQTSFAKPITKTEGHPIAETAPEVFKTLKQLEEAEHLLADEVFKGSESADVQKRQKRSLNIMQAAMRAFLGQAIEAIPTDGQDRLFTNEVCMNNRCLVFEMDLRELMEENSEEEESGEEEEDADEEYEDYEEDNENK